MMSVLGPAPLPPQRQLYAVSGAADGNDQHRDADDAQTDLGTIEVGKLVDKVVVDGNPLVNIRDTMRVRTVIADGNVYPLETLLNVPKQ